jgi:hypothetical protein
VFAGCERALERLAADDPVEVLVAVPGAGIRRVRQARCHGGYADAVGTEGDRERAHDPEQRALAGDVREHGRVRRGPDGVGGDEHDAAELPLRHARGERLYQPQRRLDVDGLHAAPGRRVEVADGRPVERRGAMDEHVASAVALEHGGRGGAGRGFGRQVAVDVAVAVEDDGAVPGALQRLGDRRPDGPSAAGDDGDPSRHAQELLSWAADGGRADSKAAENR